MRTLSTTVADPASAHAVEPLEERELSFLKVMTGRIRIRRDNMRNPG